MIRHGAVAESWRTRIYGRLDVPLSSEGELEARRMVQALDGLPLAAVISSGLARAEFTASLLRHSRGIERRDDDRFLELERGSWAGRERADIEASEPEAWAESLATGWARGPEDGERIEDLSVRVRAGLDAAARLGRGDSVCVVAHCWVLRAAVAMALGLEPIRMARIHVPTGGLVALDWPASPDGEPRLEGLGLDQWVSR